MPASKWNSEVVNNKFHEHGLYLEYLLIDCSNVAKCKDKFSVKCLKCDFIFSVTCDHFFSATKPTRCPQCNKGENWSENRLFKEWDRLSDKDNYNLCEYPLNLSSKSRITVLCKKCNKIWTPSINKFFCGNRRCPNCIESLGEKFIKLYLEKFLIPYEKEKRFVDCKDIRTLPFDYYLPTYNLLIEFHGRQHFLEQTNFSVSRKHRSSLVEIQRRDTIKRGYAIQNGYNFLEIHFDEIRWTYHIIEAYLKTLVSVEGKHATSNE